MKSNQKPLLFLIVLYLASLACGSLEATPTAQITTPVVYVASVTPAFNTPTETPTIIQPTVEVTATLSDQEAVSTRQASIQNSASFFLTPDNWLTAPQGCRYSMAHLSLTSTIKPELGLIDGSGNLIHAESRQNNEGKSIWIYHFLTASHLITKDDMGNLVNDKVVVQPLDYVGFGYQYALLDTTVIIGDNGYNQDVSPLTIIGLSPVDYQGFVPIGINNVVSGATITSTADLYYQFGYPMPHHKPQFVVSKITNIYDINNRHYARLMPEMFSSATDVGQSGGGICNQSGQIIGVHSFHENNIPDASFGNLMPSNIQDQIYQAMAKANQKLAEYGFSP